MVAGIGEKFQMVAGFGRNSKWWLEFWEKFQMVAGILGEIPSGGWDWGEIPNGGWNLGCRQRNTRELRFVLMTPNCRERHRSAKRRGINSSPFQPWPWPKHPLIDISLRNCHLQVVFPNKESSNVLWRKGTAERGTGHKGSWSRI